MEFLVTGGAGFIGSNMVRKLLEAGRSVRVLDDLSTGRRVNLDGLVDRIEFIEGSILDDDAVARAVAGVKYVLHAAALPSVIRSVQDPAPSNEVNIGGTIRMLLAARDAGAERFVLSSSSSVYGDTPTLPKREEMTPAPMSPYAIQKLTGEHYCRVFHDLYGFKAFALRYFNVFGPNQDPTSQYSAVIPRFVTALQRDEAPVIYGDGLQTRDFTFVDDVVRANLCCCTASDDAAGGVYNVAHGNRVSVKELAETISRIMGKGIKPVHEEARAGDVRDSQADPSLAKKHLGWEPSVSFEDGLERTVEYFLKAGA